MCRICTPLMPGEKEDHGSNTVEDAAWQEQQRGMDNYDPTDYND